VLLDGVVKLGDNDGPVPVLFGLLGLLFGNVILGILGVPTCGFGTV
tara:strand:- start:173 stop:310 length:138 start_codon:yes stop_codon:yes gene_type:complete